MKFRLFPALFQSPQKIKFEQQENNEVVELFLRQHPIVNLFWIILSLVLLILPPIMLQLESILSLGFSTKLPLNLLISSLIIYYSLLLAYVFEQFLSWYFNVYIVTNQHLVDINFYSLLAKEVIEISLEDIEVISNHTAGIFGSVFNFGDVMIETAAENKGLVFAKVSRPDFIADRIQNLQKQRKLFFEGGK